jgi:hypothetical protein
MTLTLAVNILQGLIKYRKVLKIGGYTLYYCY